MTMTCAGAELTLRGRGPPPVPSRMSLVFAGCAESEPGTNAPVAALAIATRSLRRSISVGVTRNPIAEPRGEVTPPGTRRRDRQPTDETSRAPVTSASRLALTNVHGRAGRQHRIG